MNLEFALVVFSLTIIALVAMAQGNERMAGKSINALKKLSLRLPSLRLRRKPKSQKKVE